MLRKLILLFLTTIVTMAHAEAAAEMLAIVEENAGHLSFYQAKTGAALGTIHLGALPHEIAVTKDGQTAYVGNFGIKDYDSGAGTPGASISVIDIPHRAEKYRLYTFTAGQHQTYEQIDSAPHGVKLRPPAEKELFVNVEKGGKLIVFDVESKKILRKITASPLTHNIFFSPDGKILWLMAGSDGVIKMDAEKGAVIQSLRFASPVRGLKYTPDHRYLMASLVNEVDFIDPATLTIEKRFTNLGVGPILYSDITPDQRYIVAPAAFDNQVVVVDVATGKAIKHIVTGLNPVTVFIDASGNFAYITNATDKHVTKLNLKDFTTTRLTTKDGPNGITFVPYSGLPKRHSLWLGVPLPLSGGDAQKGRDMMRGYEYWRLLVNRAGGVVIQNKVYDINIVYLDTMSNTSTVAALTDALINQYHVKALLSTYGAVGYNIEQQIAAQNEIAITPLPENNDVWLPSTLAEGYDYFVTTDAYNRDYYAQYNFKASNESAVATALGLSLQNALLITNDLDAKTLTQTFAQNQFNLFYHYQ